MSETQNAKVLAILGPTASSKSELALWLAQELDGEIICTDSMQVYRKLDIGTAKPTPQEREAVPHHQLDLIEPDRHYSAGAYERDTVELLQKLRLLNKVPILVGGTGLYYRAIVYGISKIPDIPSHVREEVLHWHTSHGLEYCYQKLQQMDPLASNQLHPNDTSRILRALDVILHTGLSIVKYQEQNRFTTPRVPLYTLGYSFDRSVLYERINRRTHAMLEAGWVHEVEELLKQYPSDLKSLHSIGYHQIIEFLLGQIDEKTMIEKIQQKTRNYAKRQLTWFRKEPNIHWYQKGEEAQILNDVQKFLNSK